MIARVSRLLKRLYRNSIYWLFYRNVLTLNQARRLNGLRPMEGGDVKFKHLKKVEM